MTIAFNTALILAVFAVMALRPPIPRHSSMFNLQFALGWWINEVPFLGLWLLAAGTIGTLVQPEASGWWWLVAAFTAVDALLLGWIAVRAGSARPALSEALQTVYGPQAKPNYTRPAWWRLVLPVVSWRPDVRRIRNLQYGPARRGSRLDVYVSRRGGTVTGPTPVLVYFHGAYKSKMQGSRALIYRLAAQGWVCVSASRRQFRAGYGEQLADARDALACSSFMAPLTPWSLATRRVRSPTKCARSPASRSCMQNFPARNTTSTPSNPFDSTPSPTRSCASRNSHVLDESEHERLSGSEPAVAFIRAARRHTEARWSHSAPAVDG